MEPGQDRPKKPAPEAHRRLKARLKAVTALTDTADQIAKLDHPRYAVREAAALVVAARVR